MTARRSLVSSSGRLRWSAQWKISPSVDSCVSLRSSTLLSRIGPNWVSVARIGTAELLAAQATGTRRGTPWASSRRRCPAPAVTRSLSSPGRAIPDRSPLTSASSTGTPGVRQLLGERLQRLRLAGAGRAGDEAVPVQRRERDPHPRRPDRPRRRRRRCPARARRPRRVTGGDALGRPRRRQSLDPCRPPRAPEP